MEKKENGNPGLETMPLDWFPDRAAVRAFVRGPKYHALGSLVCAAGTKDLPGALAGASRDAAFFIGKDLFELAKVAALPGEESFEYTKMEGGCAGEWKERIFLLGTVALAQGFVEEIYEPIIAMQAEAEEFLSDRHAAQVAKSAPNCLSV